MGIYQNLLQQLEIDRDLGIHFVERYHEPVLTADEATAPIAVAIPSAPTAGNPQDRLSAIAANIAACTRCGLCEKRKNAVAGAGNTQPEIVFVGEGPGADEDKQGLPFVGAAGQLLDKMIVAMGLSREEVFISNVVKCRPPGNRTPELDEAKTCLAWLEQQMDILQPKIICTLGNTPLRALSGNDSLGITRQRGQAFQWRGIAVIPTFHPSYLLRNAEAKKPCWDDLQLVMEKIGRPLPKK
ncbi:MAG: uracil-DNA glycosylase [Planctomycetes bacterium]|nr:uracil-DNA glycosylase [Planctomycetota bacterium]